MTHIAKVYLKSMSPYGQSRFHNTEKLPKEGADDYDKRTWRERQHYNEFGNIIIPAQCFSGCIRDAAKYLSIQIPGKGKSTYTKHFASGVSVFEPLVLKIKKDQTAFHDLYLNSDGIRGSAKRVIRRMPILPSWEGWVEFMIFDDTITKDVFEHVLREAGKFIGIGQFRPQNGGSQGRFMVEKLQWSSYGD